MDKYKKIKTQKLLESISNKVKFKTFGKIKLHFMQIK